MKFLTWVVLLALAGVALQHHIPGCRNYCPSPYNWQKYVCCDKKINKPVATCPLERLTACRKGFGIEPPRRCFYDIDCPGISKCCYDDCVNFKTCKNPVLSRPLRPVFTTQRYSTMD